MAFKITDFNGIGHLFCYVVNYVVGLTGNVTIDKNGDRHADYSLLDMNPRTGMFEVS